MAANRAQAAEAEAQGDLTALEPGLPTAGAVAAAAAEGGGAGGPAGINDPFALYRKQKSQRYFDSMK